MKIVALIASVTFWIASAKAECDPKSCPNRNYLAHYTELGCTPIYVDSDPCCPAQFDCSARQDLRNDRCYFEGNEFKIGEELAESVTPTCLVGCRCINDYLNPQTASINCVSIECPELFMGLPEPGCVLLYENDTMCCSTGSFCGNSTEAEVTCEYGGSIYVQGQKFYPEEEPCMSCLCQPGFNGSLVEPHCHSVKCNVELHYTSRIRQRCVPVYYKNSCCPIDWLCPDDANQQKMSSVNATSQVHNDSNIVCEFGALKFDKGNSLPAEIAGDCVSCECAIPPVPTCVKDYDTCN